jgi:hypothetical protein
MSATNVTRQCGVERKTPIATKSMMKKICGSPKDVLSVTCARLHLPQAAVLLIKV